MSVTKLGGIVYGIGEAIEAKYPLEGSVLKGLGAALIVWGGRNAITKAATAVRFR